MLIRESDTVGGKDRKTHRQDDTSLAMSCMYRGLVRKRERKLRTMSKKDCVLAAHIHKHERPQPGAFFPYISLASHYFLLTRFVLSTYIFKLTFYLFLSFYLRGL